MSEEKLVCHICEESLEAFSKKSVAVCCKKKCQKAFCKKCIVGSINKDFKMKDVKPETWVCYSCGGSCPCSACAQKNKMFALAKQNSSQRSLRSNTAVDEHPKRNTRSGQKQDANARVTRLSATSSKAASNEQSQERKKGGRKNEDKAEEARKTRKDSTQAPRSRQSPGKNKEKETSQESNDSSSNQTQESECSEKESENKSSARRSLRGRENSLDYYKPEIIDNMKRKQKREKSANKDLENFDRLNTSFNSPNTSTIQIMIINPVVENVSSLGRGMSDEGEKVPLVDKIDFEAGLSQILDNGNIIESLKVEVNKAGNFLNLKRKDGKVDILKIENRYLHKKKLLKFKSGYPKLEHKATVIQSTDLS